MFMDFTYAEFIKMVQHVMVRQCILLSGSFKEKQERNHRVGYDFDASTLTAEDRKLAEVRMTDTEMNSLVELAYREAALICTQILHIPAPKPTVRKPINLAPLGVPIPKAKHSGVNSDSEESDLDDEEVDEEEEPEQVSEPFSGQANSQESRTITLAAHDAARYSALCDDYENAVKELDSLPPPRIVAGPPPPPPAPVPTGQIPVQSEFIDRTESRDPTLSVVVVTVRRVTGRLGLGATGTSVTPFAVIDRAVVPLPFLTFTVTGYTETEPVVLLVLDGSGG
ncbi:hypothetical protein B0H10DRAFT_2444375, partial [Mycena sp. CBHHK59/15]